MGKNFKHTAGQWEAKPGNQLQEYLVCTEEMDISIVLAIDIPDEEAEANAKLIAAAPDLLEALLACDEMLSKVTDKGIYSTFGATGKEIKKQIAAAISKATTSN